MRLIGLAVVLAVGLMLAPLAPLRVKSAKALQRLSRQLAWEGSLCG
jgi:hypothetical protein